MLQVRQNPVSGYYVRLQAPSLIFIPSLQYRNLSIEILIKDNEKKDITALIPHHYHGTNLVTTHLAGSNSKRLERKGYGFFEEDRAAVRDKYIMLQDSPDDLDVFTSQQRAMIEELEAVRDLPSALQLAFNLVS
jgi:hypothetical protein